MKYRKKPVEIEAVRFVGVNSGRPIFGPGPQELGWYVDDEHNPEWLREAAGKRGGADGEQGALWTPPVGDFVHINTFEGTMRANKGDWIIRGVAGEIYPCKPDIFAKSYEEVK